MRLPESGSLKGVDATEKALAAKLGSFRNKPYEFVLFAYQWGEGELEGMEGPDEWQKELLLEIERLLETGLNEQEAIRFATASGHGVGKTAMVAWIIHWFSTTRPNSQIVVTANTQSQLMTKTWRELAKWHRLAINRHWFKWTATAFMHVLYPETWRANAIPWSENNSEAFAGTHEMNGVLVIFDEASAITNSIWDVVEGAMTTPGAMWLAFGNPTRSNGKFYDCFTSMSHRWKTYKVDSRKAKACNQKEIAKWIDDYGEDSDFVRVRVRGEFPKQAINQFIPSDLVQESMRRSRPRREMYGHLRANIGVDVARYGSDVSVIAVRQGPIVDSVIDRFYQLDTMTLAGKVLDKYRSYGSNAVVCVDGVGVGAGVVDRLRQLGVPCIDVQSAAKSFDVKQYANKRSELYGRLLNWLRADGCLPSDNEIADQFRAIEYQYNNRLQIQLMSKEDIRKETGGSPDVADAIVYTFAAEEALELGMNARARIIIPSNF